MSLVIYEPVKDEFRSLDETDLIRFQDVPQVGGTVAIGSDRRWSIVAIETYQAGDRTASLVFIAPEGAKVPDQAEWMTAEMREAYPSLSFDVQIWQKSILGSGWSMDGIAPTGRLYGSKPTDHPTLMVRTPRPWTVDIIETYKPTGEASYTAVHVCHCVPVSLPELAIA